jgi:hypothetical protein
VAVNKDVLSLFDESGRVNLREWRLDAWSGWDHAAFEKMLRVTHIGAFLLAGLSTAGQNAFWITDEDAIASNIERLDQLVDQLAHLLDRCLPHSLGHLRVATTAADTGIKDLEDLAAIPDLFGGARSGLLNAYLATGVHRWHTLDLPKPGNPKTSQIMGFLAKAPKQSQTSLCR